MPCGQFMRGKSLRHLIYEAHTRAKGIDIGSDSYFVKAGLLLGDSEEEEDAWSNGQTATVSKIFALETLRRRQHEHYIQELEDARDTLEMGLEASWATIAALRSEKEAAQKEYHECQERLFSTEDSLRALQKAHSETKEQVNALASSLLEATLTNKKLKEEKEEVQNTLKAIEARRKLDTSSVDGVGSEKKRRKHSESVETGHLTYGSHEVLHNNHEFFNADDPSAKSTDAAGRRRGAAKRRDPLLGGSTAPAPKQRARRRGTARTDGLTRENDGTLEKEESRQNNTLQPAGVGMRENVTTRSDSKKGSKGQHGGEKITAEGLFSHGVGLKSGIKRQGCPHHLEEDETESLGLPIAHVPVTRASSQREAVVGKTKKAIATSASSATHTSGAAFSLRSQSKTGQPSSLRGSATTRTRGTTEAESSTNPTSLMQPDTQPGQVGYDGRTPLRERLRSHHKK